MGNNKSSTTFSSVDNNFEEEATEFTEADIKFVFNELRKSSVIWDGRKEVLRRASKKVFVRRSKTGKAIYKLHWQCSPCQKWFKDIRQLEVDHIVEIGGVSEFKGDWNETIRKILPRPVEKHLQVICITCHQKKTKAYMSAYGKWERKK